jgi:hypothetical protein
VPKDVLPMLDGTIREASALVAAGLWVEQNGGYAYHDWHQYQPTRQAVIDRRAKSAERLRKWRAERDLERQV